MTINTGSLKKEKRNKGKEMIEPVDFSTYVEVEI